MGPVEGALDALAGLPPWLVYLVLGAGAATENLAPPVPADAFVVAGAVIATRGALQPWGVFAVTWLANVTAAVGVFYVARWYGASFFKMPLARLLLREHQLEELSRFYRRWGVPAILFGRLIPGWRGMVPVFAGVSKMRPAAVLPTLLVASGGWYGFLVYLGLVAGRNLDLISRVLTGGGRLLLWVGVALLAVFAAWWWRTRHPRET